MTIRRKLSFAVAMLAIATAAAAHRQAKRPSSGSDIVVTGHREEQVRRFVGEMAPWRYGRQLARWNESICVRITGLDAMPDKAALIRNHITEAARSVRIAVRTAADCHPNVLIAFSTAADALTAKVIEHYPDLIKDVRRFGLPHGHDRAPYLEPRAVRWFAVDDEVMNSCSSPGMPSRIVQQTKENARLSYAIVDESRVGGITWGQLADYLAMAMLTRPAIDATYQGQDSILALFDDKQADTATPVGMTRQDRAYLAALYATNPQLPPDAARDQIKRRMLAALAKPNDAQGGP